MSSSGFFIKLFAISLRQDRGHEWMNVSIFVMFSFSYYLSKYVPIYIATHIQISFIEISECVDSDCFLLVVTIGNMCISVLLYIRIFLYGKYVVFPL